jgi:hypothetical protein
LADLEFHPAANLFPLMEGDAAFVADVQANGLQEEIRLLGGKILDGRNRYRACKKAAVEPRFRNMPPDTDPVRYVVSLNLHRRHLSESQRAMIAGSIANLKDGENRDGTSALPSQARISIGDAAELMHVGRRTVVEARKVMADAIPEVVATVVGKTVGVLRWVPDEGFPTIL